MKRSRSDSKIFRLSRSRVVFTRGHEPVKRASKYRLSPSIHLLRARSPRAPSASNPGSSRCHPSYTSRTTASIAAPLSTSSAPPRIPRPLRSASMGRSARGTTCVSLGPVQSATSRFSRVSPSRQQSSRGGCPTQASSSRERSWSTRTKRTAKSARPGSVQDAVELDGDHAFGDCGSRWPGRRRQRTLATCAATLLPKRAAVPQAATWRVQPE